MSTLPHKGTAERRALAEKVARMRADGIPWDGVGGIVAQGVVNSATRGRELLREVDHVEAAGGILPSYDRYEMNPRTGKRKGHREPKARKTS